MRKETEKVVEIIQEAGKIAMSYFEQLKDHHISTKDDGSLLTIADLEVDKFLRESLESAFPEYSVLSEESKDTRKTECIWIIDPIDGTKNFASGDSNFGISIGLVKNGIPEIGVIYGPAKNKLYIGEKNGEAYCNGEKIQVSSQSNIHNMRAFIHEGRRARTIATQKPFIDAFEKEGAILEKVKTCATLDICAVAEGSFDAFIHYNLDAWDIAAGIAILEAAGGTVSQLDGSPKNIFEPGIIATNPILHDKIVTITKNCI